MEHELINNKLSIHLSGRINSSNDSQISEEINNLISKYEFNLLEIDLKDVEYVSSAGLRIFLTLRKASDNFRIINVNPEVYEVFDDTGFTKMINIYKVFKEISIKGCELIGQGFMGKIYRLNEDQIIKVNYRKSSLDDMMFAREMSQKIVKLSLPTALSYKIVKIKDRKDTYGSVYELIKDDTIAELIANNPNDFDKYLKAYADLFITFSKTEDKERSLPSKKTEAIELISKLSGYDYFTPEEEEKLNKMVQEIPDYLYVIHGDYHVKNVMLQGNNPILIDMDTIGYGHKIFELTPMYMTYFCYPSTDEGNLERFLGITDEQASKLYDACLKALYPNESEEKYTEIKEKCALLGYAFLVYKTIQFELDNEERLNHSIEEAKRLLKKYDSLDF